MLLYVLLFYFLIVYFLVVGLRRDMPLDSFELIMNGIINLEFNMLNTVHSPCLPLACIARDLSLPGHFD